MKRATYLPKMGKINNEKSQQKRQQQFTHSIYSRIIQIMYMLKASWHQNKRTTRELKWWGYSCTNLLSSMDKMWFLSDFGCLVNEFFSVSWNFAWKIDRKCNIYYCKFGCWADFFICHVKQRLAYQNYLNFFLLILGPFTCFQCVRWKVTYVYLNMVISVRFLSWCA